LIRLTASRRRRGPRIRRRLRLAVKRRTYFVPVPLLAISPIRFDANSFNVELPHNLAGFHFNEHDAIAAEVSQTIERLATAVRPSVSGFDGVGRPAPSMRMVVGRICNPANINVAEVAKTSG
jgi:hypothetical protein